MYHDNFFSLFSPDATLGDAYTVTRDGGRPAAHYKSIDVSMPTADTFDLHHDGRKIGRGFNDGITLHATVNGTAMRGDCLDAILDRAAIR